MISNVLTYDQTTTILKQRSIIREHMLGGVASNLGKKPDWFSIFDENIQEAKEDLNKNSYKYEQERLFLRIYLLILFIMLKMPHLVKKG